MVDRYFRVKVGDFNLSRVAVASVRDSKGTGGHSAAYSTGGLHSPRWMAPEVLQNATYSRASDVYSFAVVMWSSDRFQVPWAQYGQWQVMTAVVEEGQRPPLDEVPTPSFEHLTIYDELMEDGWSQEPGDRPAFEEIITRLQGLIDMHAKGVAVSKSKEQAPVGAGGKPEGERKHRRTISFGSLRMSSEKAIRQSADKATEEVKAASQPGSPPRMSAAEDESAADKVMTRILSRKQVRSSNPCRRMCVPLLRLQRIPCDSPQTRSVPPWQPLLPSRRLRRGQAPRPPQMSLSPPLRGTSRSLSSLLTKTKRNRRL